jgi:hypothetical protein
MLASRREGVKNISRYLKKSSKNVSAKIPVQYL